MKLVCAGRAMLSSYSPCFPSNPETPGGNEHPHFRGKQAAFTICQAPYESALGMGRCRP